ncbi:MAG: hypothetical protein ACI9VI_003275 [Candidatus Azotimanducaceae bacterium]|jgi:hypothetical protein
MNTYLGKLVIIACLLMSVFSHAKSVEQASAMQTHTFSYSIVKLLPDNTTALNTLKRKLMPELIQQGAIPYATWVFAAKPVDAPFAGLAEDEIGLMLAWPNDTLPQVRELNETLQSISTIDSISTRLFKAIYLPAGLNFPKEAGFYVHREEKYGLADVNDAVRLSHEAWKTWEPHWGTMVIGLFRELGGATADNNLNRIVWYPSYEAWMETRNFAEEPESAIRFRERMALLIPGSGIAIATDRALP